MHVPPLVSGYVLNVANTTRARANIAKLLLACWIHLGRTLVCSTDLTIPFRRDPLGVIPCLLVELRAITTPRSTPVEVE